jgi:hypothetical protein
MHFQRHGLIRPQASCKLGAGHRKDGAQQVLRNAAAVHGFRDDETREPMSSSNHDKLTLRPACAKLKLRFREGRQAQGDDFFSTLMLSLSKHEPVERWGLS